MTLTRPAKGQRFCECGEPIISGRFCYECQRKKENARKNEAQRRKRRARDESAEPERHT